MATLPALFVSHGAPTMAIEDQHPWTAALGALGKQLGKPKAALVVSAHWQERGAMVAGAAVHPETIYDFGGFPDELYRIRYPAPGAPELAARVAQIVQTAGVATGVDRQRGLDHGAWVPLRRLFPDADVPSLQLSLPYPATAAQLLKVGEALRPLRDEGILIVGSGGATHNLRRLAWGQRSVAPEPWALQFDQWLWDAARKDDRKALQTWETSAPHARLSHPSSEHLEPVFVALGARKDGEHLREVHSSFEMGSLSLRSFLVGG